MRMPFALCTMAERGRGRATHFVGGQQGVNFPDSRGRYE